MSGLEKSLFQLKFTAKQLNRQAAKASKEEQREKNKVKKALIEGNNDIAQIYAQNAIRKSQERLNLLRLSSRIDAVASRIQTAVTMRQVTGNMSRVVKGMDKAMETMNLERITMVMDKFEEQFEDMESSTNYYENVSREMNATQQPEDQVELLMQQVADEAGLELKHKIGDAKVENLNVPEQKEAAGEETEDKLSERLRALRN
ncbi:DEKNAAC101926 [Brettanomyces naardenensis]|uniref:DEKNAAC101926 n=1 Tax=Brettanomyces naardenensis TaxID=13370 RepID=A0A448YJJ0_BRENA|nr:DEKNAAC101926 [Brettanomyces naardenensis]